MKTVNLVAIIILKEKILFKALLLTEVLVITDYAKVVDLSYRILVTGEGKDS